MATKKKIAGMKNLRDGEGSDATYDRPKESIIKFDAKTIVRFGLDKTTNTATIRVTDTFTGAQLEGSVELQEVE